MGNCVAYIRQYSKAEFLIWLRKFYNKTVVKRLNNFHFFSFFLIAKYLFGKKIGIEES